MEQLPLHVLRVGDESCIEIEWVVVVVSLIILYKRANIITMDTISLCQESTAVCTERLSSDNDSIRWPIGIVVSKSYPRDTNTRRN